MKAKNIKRLYEVVQSNSPEWIVGYLFYTHTLRNKKEVLEDAKCREFIVERQPFKIDGEEVQEL